MKIWEVGRGASVARKKKNRKLKIRTCVAKLEGHEHSVRCLAVLDGGQLASGSADTKIKIWDLSTEACVTTLQGHRNGVLYVEVLEDGRLASGSKDNTITIWDSALPNVLASG